MDLDALLQSYGEEAPSGEDLEYDPVFTEMEIAAQPGEERQVGDEIIPGEDPDYKEVAEKALDILQRSHDLRAGVFMAEAQIRLRGFEGLADATGYIAGCLQQHWESCHPQLDEDDDNDPTMRINAVFSLADQSRVVRGVRRAPLAKSRVFGVINLRDIAVADGVITPPADMETVHDQAAIAAAFQDSDQDDLKAISASVARCVENVEAITAAFDEHTPGQGPDLDPLLTNLRTAKTKIAGVLGSADEGAAADPEAADDMAAEANGSAAPVAAGTGAIHSTADVISAIDRIIAYYQRSEPSSPVPMLMQRAKTLVGADFMTVVEDMAPSGMEMVRLIGGIREED